MKLKCLLIEFAADQSGATAIEYGLIAAGIALAIIEVIYALGTNLVAKLQSLGDCVEIGCSSPRRCVWRGNNPGPLRADGGQERFA